MQPLPMMLTCLLTLTAVHGMAAQSVLTPGPEGDLVQYHLTLNDLQWDKKKSEVDLHLQIVGNTVMVHLTSAPQAVEFV